MSNPITLEHPRDELVISTSETGELLINGQVLGELLIRTETPPVRVEAVDPTGQWIFLPSGDWRADPAGSGIYATLNYTDGEEPVTHTLEIQASADPQETKPKPVPIKIKPIIVAPDEPGSP